MSSKEENIESCLDVRLSINICKNYSVKVQKLADINRRTKYIHKNLLFSLKMNKFVVKYDNYTIIILTIRKG